MLLDGITLDEAIQLIDSETRKNPLGYLVTCTHTSVIQKLMASANKYKRLIGVQPNGSNLSPKELAALDKPVTDSPKEFVAEVMRLKSRLGLKIISGCCGTCKEHLREIVKVYSRAPV